LSSGADWWQLSNPDDPDLLTRPLRIEEIYAVTPVRS
jgi:hypothetical protein